MCAQTGHFALLSYRPAKFLDGPPLCLLRMPCEGAPGHLKGTGLGALKGLGSGPLKGPWAQKRPGPFTLYLPSICNVTFHLRNLLQGGPDCSGHANLIRTRNIVSQRPHVSSELKEAQHVLHPHGSFSFVTATQEKPTKT